MNEGRQRPGVVGPLILITIGVILLLNQMGRLTWDIWGTLWRLWPVILILIGLDILVGASRSTLVHILGLLMAILIIGGTIFYAVRGGPLPTSGESAQGSETLLEEMQDASSGRIMLKPGIARTEVRALSESANFVEGKIEYGRYSQRAEKDFSVSSGQAIFSLRQRSRSAPFWWPGEDIAERWNLQFTPRIPLEISIDSGVGSTMLDLSRLKVTRFDLNAGVGSTTVIFPAAAGQTRASIDGGVGLIKVRIPDGVGARVRVSSGLGSVHVSHSRLERSGNEYISSDYNTAENKLDLDIRGGVGNISIE